MSRPRSVDVGPGSVLCRHWTLPDPKRVRFEIATTPAVQDAALRLTHDAYVAGGLMTKDPTGRRVLQQHREPTTTVFVATVDSAVALTSSLALDGACGLPMEGTYPELVASCRERHSSLAEVFGFAGKRERSYPFLPLATGLVAAMIEFARQRAVELALITVHPRHLRFYERLLGFRQIASGRPHRAVRDKPSVPCALSLGNVGIDADVSPFISKERAAA